VNSLSQRLDKLYPNTSSNSSSDGINYCKVLYNQRNKDETIILVTKRLFGEHITSRLVRIQNRELSFKCIAYNMHRLTNLTIISMVSTEPFTTSGY
jgi:hypothetical protein